MSYFGLPLHEYETLLLVENGQLFIKSDAVLRIVRQLPLPLPLPWPLLTCFRWVPRCLRDGIYDVIARNRYKWFGKRDVCLVPGDVERERFLGGKH